MAEPRKIDGTDMRQDRNQGLRNCQSRLGGFLAAHVTGQVPAHDDQRREHPSGHATETMSSHSHVGR